MPKADERGSIARARAGILAVASSISIDRFRIQALRDVMVLLVGTGAAQALQLAATPLLLRLYDPTPYGIYAICLGVAATLAVFQTFRLEVVIPVSLHLSTAARTLAAIRLLSLGLFAIQLIVIAVFQPLLQPILGRIAGDYVVLAVIPCLALAQAWFTAYRAALLRLRRYQAASLGALLRTVVFVLAATVLALMRPLYPQLDLWGLLVAQLLAECTAVAISAIFLTRRFRQAASMRRLRRVRTAIVKGRHLFGTISTAQIIATLNQSLPSWIVGSIYGAEIAGWLALAQRLSLGPAQLVSTSVGGVVSQRAAVRHRTGQPIFPPLSEILLNISFTSAPVFIALAALAYYFTGPIFGAQWKDASSSISIMMIVGIAAVMYGSIEGIPILLQLKRFIVGWHILRLAMLLFGYWLIITTGLRYIQWLLIYTLGEALLYSIFCLKSLRAAAHSDGGLT